MGVMELRLNVLVKFGDLWSNRSGEMRLAHLVKDERHPTELVAIGGNTIWRFA